MFRPNVPCNIIKMDGEKTLYGESRPGTLISTRCGVVRLEVGALKTTVRADASASRGNAEEKVAQSRLLFDHTESISPGDKVEVGSFELEVESVFPRYTVNGLLDHLQVDLKIWASA